MSSKAVRLLELAQIERDLAWHEYIYGRSYKCHIEIANKYEEMAAKTLGEDTVKKYVMAHGDFIIKDNRLYRVFHKT